MELIQIFKNACSELQKDPRYLALAAVRKQNDADQELDRLTREFAETKKTLSEELEKQVRNNDLVVELNAKANKLYGELMSYPGIVAYNKAKLEVDQLVGHIDAVLTAALNGEDPQTVAAPVPEKSMPCTGDCSSCGSSCR